jgi:hypothetical protein
MVAHIMGFRPREFPADRVIETLLSHIETLSRGDLNLP